MTTLYTITNHAGNSVILKDVEAVIKHIARHRVIIENLRDDKLITFANNEGRIHSFLANDDLIRHYLDTWGTIRLWSETRQAPDQWSLFVQRHEVEP